MLCPGMVCVLCAVQGETVSPYTAHSTHTIPGHNNMLPHRRIIHNDIILCAVQGETVTPYTAHSTHTISGDNILPHCRIIHNDIILPIVLT
jgi:regulator of extracellular matrix RemA (YlzA/DUF370 family)